MCIFLPTQEGHRNKTLTELGSSLIGPSGTYVARCCGLSGNTVKPPAGVAVDEAGGGCLGLWQCRPCTKSSRLAETGQTQSSRDDPSAAGLQRRQLQLVPSVLPPCGSEQSIPLEVAWPLSNSPSNVPGKWTESPQTPTCLPL